MFSQARIVLDPFYAQTYDVYRSKGYFADNGRWTENAPTIITMYGVVSVVNAKDITMGLAGDRIKGTMVFHSVQEIFVTRGDDEATDGTSDRIKWRGDFYKIFNVWDYSDYGFYKAYGEKVKGN